MNTSTRFTRSSSDKMIAGVCGGIARYFNIDPVIVRLVFVLSVLIGGVTPFVYLILWLVMPEDQTTTWPAPNQTYQQPALPTTYDHPRAQTEWKFDPHTGERIQRDS